MNKALRQLQDKLSAQARTWPRPGELVFHIEDDHVWLDKIRLPHTARGEGSRRMAEFLAAVDQAHIPVCLVADPLPDDDEPAQGIDEPQTFHLVRWYMRFGFVPLGPSEDGFLMERPAQTARPVHELLKDAQARKRNDITQAEFATRFPPSSRRSYTP